MYVIVAYSCNKFKAKVVLCTTDINIFLKTMFINPVAKSDEIVFGDFECPVEVYRVAFNFFRLLVDENITECKCKTGYNIAILDMSRKFDKYGMINFVKIINKMNII